MHCPSQLDVLRFGHTHQKVNLVEFRKQVCRRALSPNVILARAIEIFVNERNSSTFWEIHLSALLPRVR